jgi:hypothetical protein
MTFREKYSPTDDGLGIQLIDTLRLQFEVQFDLLIERTDRAASYLRGPTCMFLEPGLFI